MSLSVYPYDREAAVAYAKKWAFSRNPDYYNFNRLGGDCTNFASQCVFAGCGVMNFTPTFGWFYRSLNDRTPSWTGVEYLYNFLTRNETEGPFGQEVALSQVQIGDIVQLGRETGDFYHSPVVVGFSGGQPIVAAHSYDALYKPLFSYRADIYRVIRIDGYRK